MKTLVVYKSRSGNTEKLAEKLASILNADLKKPSEVKKSSISKYDLVGFGSGIYNGRHDSKILNLIDIAELPEKTFIFSTAGMAFLKGLWHYTIKKHLKKKNTKIVGDFIFPGETKHGPFTVIGGAHSGRPNKEDLKKAENLVKKLI